MQAGNSLLQEIFMEAQELELIRELGWALNPEEEFQLKNAFQKIKDFAKRTYSKAKPYIVAADIMRRIVFPSTEPVPMLKHIATYVEQDKTRRRQNAIESAQSGRKYKIIQQPNHEASLMQEILMETEDELNNQEYFVGEYEEHTKGARPSTKGKHEKGQTRKIIDRGGEKGDERRDVPRKRPSKWKGPWPPNE